MPPWGIVAVKDLRLLCRDRAALFWVVAFPLVFALFFGSVMKADGEPNAAIAVVVVNDGASDEQSVERMQSFLDHAGLRVSRATDAAARAAVRRGDVVAFVRVANNDDAPIELGIDPSRRREGALLQTLLGTSAAGIPATARPAVVVTSVARTGVARSGYEIVFPAMVLWGLLGCAAAFAVSMVAERSTGCFVRLRAAPLTRVSILAAKAAACATACTLDAILLSAIGWLVLGVHIADAGKFIAAVAAMVLCFSGLTMVLSVLGTSEQAVAGAGWATLILMAMIGGAMVPVAMFPQWLLSVSDFSPVRWGILALEGATWRDFHWSELAKPLLVLTSVGLLAFAAGVGVLASQREL